MLTCFLKRSSNEAFLGLVKTELSKEVGEKIMTIAEQFIEQGREQEAIEVALSMLEEGFDEKMIARLTGLNKEKIQDLLKLKKH